MAEPAAGVSEATRLHFFAGARAVLRGVQFLVATPRAWPLAMAPAVILVILFGVAAALAIRFVAPWAMPPLSPDSLFGRIGAGALRLFVMAACVLGAAMIAAWCTPLLSGPALERIILLREKALGVSERPPVPFMTELWCGLRAQLVGLAVGAPALALLWLITTFVPPLAVVTVPTKLLIVALLVAWNLLDYPLSLRGLRLRERLALMRRSASAVLGFGAAIAVLFAVPFGAIVLLPAGVAGAAEIAVLLMQDAASRTRGAGP